MVSLPPLKTIALTLQYSGQFSYPLTVEELHYWQIKSHYSLKKINNLVKTQSVLSGYYFPFGKKSFVMERKLRSIYSQRKWNHVRRIAPFISLLPSVRGLFVTGALSMNNCPENDDIDIMIITSPSTLWSTRLFVVSLLSLFKLRRPPHLPEHSSSRVSNKICDNLYLESDCLQLGPPSLYLAHEILQTSPLFDKDNLKFQMLLHNPWVKNYLPVAYAHQLQALTPSSTLPNLLSPLIIAVFKAINYYSYILQFNYMKPSITHERISRHAAFFHPRRQNYDLSI